MSWKALILSSPIILFLAGCATKYPPGDEWLQEPQQGGGEAVCLEEGVAETGLGRVLGDIPKPILAAVDQKPDNMYPTPLWEISVCSSNTGCEQEEVSDYVLVATDVKVGQVIIPNPDSPYPDRSDRQLAKQLSTPESPFSSDYEDRLYRAFCGDWCYPSSLSEGYRGTFYCDFILYLKSDNPSGNPLLGHPLDPNMPPDDAVFDIYFRKEASIPEKIKCQGSQTGLGFQAEDQDIPQFFINFNNFRWFFREEETVKKKKVMREKPGGPRWLMGTTEIPELKAGTFMMYVDLFFDAPEDEEELIIYAVHEDEVRDVIDNSNADGETRITYYEFQKAVEWKPGGRTLQLGTFAPPITAGWFKTWLTESKPAIYLYPEQKLAIGVKLSPAGRLTVSEPLYSPGGWQGVVVYPDGRLEYQGQSYPYLYYEADLEKVFVGEEGFVVKGRDLVSFFREILPRVGLNQWETADFIQYWMDRLDRNQPYYFIHFLSSAQIESLEPLTLSVEPDVEIRVRPYFKPLDKPIEVERQALDVPPERKGFTLVEWGGILDK